jgi:hypothetical protein
MTDIGFTGTRSGMSIAQIETLSWKLDRLLAVAKPSQARHGMCIGSDLDFHHLCRARGFFIIGHPGVGHSGVSSTRALDCVCDLTLPEKPYILRDHDIVEQSGLLLATPAGMAEEKRSGTWTTVRYARKLKRPILIVFPDGTIREENQ